MKRVLLLISITIIMVILASCGEKSVIRDLDWGATANNVINSERENYNSENFRMVATFADKDKDNKNTSMYEGAIHKNYTENEYNDLSDEEKAALEDANRIHLSFDEIQFTGFEHETTSIEYIFATDFSYPMFDEKQAATNVLVEQNKALKSPILLHIAVNTFSKPVNLQTMKQNQDEYNKQLLKELTNKYGEAEKNNEVYRWETNDSIILFSPDQKTIHYLAKYNAIKNIIKAN